MIDETKCNECIAGYFLTSTFKCCGVEHCSICNNDNLNKCDICDNYFLIDSNFSCKVDC